MNKPQGYLGMEDDAAKVRRIAFDLRVEVLAAQNLDREARTTPNVFIKCELHVGSRVGESIPREGKNKGGEWKRRSAVRHSKNPDFAGDTLEFLGVEDVVPELSFVRYVPFLLRCWFPSEIDVVSIVQRQAGSKYHERTGMRMDFYNGRFCARAGPNASCHALLVLRHNISRVRIWSCTNSRLESGAMGTADCYSVPRPALSTRPAYFM